MGGFIDAITGRDEIEDAARDAANMQRLQPFQFTGPLGGANITETGATVSGGIGSELASPFAAFAGEELRRAGIMPGGQFFLDPNTAFAGAGATDPTAGNFTAAGNTLLQRLQGFDPDAFASQQFERLNRLAAPGEETAAAQTANELFARGRLGSGDSVSGRVFRDLDLSQALARDNRLLQAIGLAGRESDRLFGQATGAAGLGANLDSAATQRFLQAINAGTGVGQFQEQLRNSALQRALGGLGGIQASTAGQQQALQAALTGAGLSTNARVGAASTIAAGGQAAGNATGNLTAGILGGLTGFFG